MSIETVSPHFKDFKPLDVMKNHKGQIVMKNHKGQIGICVDRKGTILVMSQDEAKELAALFGHNMRPRGGLKDLVMRDSGVYRTGCALPSFAWQVSGRLFARSSAPKGFRL